MQVKACSFGDFWKETQAEQNSFLRLQGSGDLADGLGSRVCRGSVVRATEARGDSLWGKGQDRVRVRVGTGHLCRDKENIRQSRARLCSSSAGRCAG